MNNIENLAIEKQPQIKPLWLVIDEQGYPIHCASYKEACNEHINDAINDFDLTEAKYWKVVEAEPKALQSSEPVAEVRKVSELPVGAKFKYLGSDKVFVLLDRTGYGLCCEYSDQINHVGQHFYSISNDIGLNELDVEHITLPPSTVSLEEHNKRIAELEADIDTYVPIANQQSTEIVQLQATNKKLLDALDRLCGTKTSAGWLGEIDDMLFSMLDGEQYGKVSREINRAKAEGLKAIADADGTG